MNIFDNPLINIAIPRSVLTIGEWAFPIDNVINRTIPSNISVKPTSFYRKADRERFIREQNETWEAIILEWRNANNIIKDGN